MLRRFKLPRPRFWLPLAAAMLLALCVRFDLHYHVIGFFRGDEYYQGLPTSYWRDAAAYRVHGPPAWLRLLHRWLPQPRRDELLPVYKGGVEALPVLGQLAQDPDTNVEIRLSVLRSFMIERSFRARESWEFKDREPWFVPEVFEVARRCLEDSNADIWQTSARLLLYGDDPEPAFQLLFEHHVEQLRDPAPAERMAGILGLGQLTGHCEPKQGIDLLRRIRSMENDPTRAVQDHARTIAQQCVANVTARE